MVCSLEMFNSIYVLGLKAAGTPFKSIRAFAGTLQRTLEGNPPAKPTLHLSHTSRVFAFNENEPSPQDA